MRWLCRTVAAAYIVLGLALPSYTGEVALQIRDGLVTLDTKDATIREIFAEWARVGQTRIVNAERVPGAPMTLHLEGVPERQALEVVLRSIAGFVAAPRAVAQTSASLYDRIMLLPAPRPAVVPASGNAAASPMPSQPQFQRSIPPPPPIVADDQDDELPAVQMPVPGQPGGAPQPGMMVPMPQAPYGRAGGSPLYPNQGGYNPGAGVPYPYNPNGPVPGAAGQQQTAPPTPQSASRPGMPTALPPPPTNPIK